MAFPAKKARDVTAKPTTKRGQRRYELRHDKKITLRSKTRSLQCNR